MGHPNDRRVERVFLDANVLFSAAIGSVVCRTICALPKVLLVTSDYCAEEARRNLAAKGFDDGSDWLVSQLTTIQIVPTPPPATWRKVAGHLPDNAISDRPVLAAAVACRCDTLITGNTRDFGRLIAVDHPAPGLPTVVTPRVFLSRGPV
ncbi:MAG: PIN domain-containing protein [Actinomycetes bacterium]